MIQNPIERRSEFRFPVVLPVKYFQPDNIGIWSYCQDLSRSGTFISSDNHPTSVGSEVGLHLTIPADSEYSKIIRKEAMVMWNRMEPFKSKRSGMGVKFAEPLPESVLLNALVDNMKKLQKEGEAKRKVEKKLATLESQLQEAERLAALGRYAEKILSDISTPILDLSKKLANIKRKIDKHNRMIESSEQIDEKKLKMITSELSNCSVEIDQVLKDYALLSELVHMLRDDKESLKRRLKKKYRS